MRPTRLRWNPGDSPFVWEEFMHFSYMHASQANLEALYRMRLGVKAHSQYDCSAARVLAPHRCLNIAVSSSNVARKPVYRIFGGVVD